MPHPSDRPLFADFRNELSGLGSELRELAVARWELARLEMAQDGHALRILILCLLAALAAVLTSLPLLASALADVLAGCCGVGRGGWLAIFGGGLFLSAIVGSALAWRRFRRQITGMQETLAELREDLAWLKEKGEGGRAKGD